MVVASRKPQVGDRIQDFGENKGTLVALHKDFFKYEILWDKGNRREKYSQKEFSKWFEVLVPESKAEDVEEKQISLFGFPEQNHDSVQDVELPNEGRQRPKLTSSPQQDDSVQVSKTLEQNQVEGVRSLLQDTYISWDSLEEAIQPIFLKILGIKSESKAPERIQIIEAINSRLPPASRCAWSRSQEAAIAGLPNANQMVKCLGKKTSFNFPDEALLDYYRSCWKRFDVWEKKQSAAIKIKKQPCLSFADSPEQNDSVKVSKTFEQNQQDFCGEIFTLIESGIDDAARLTASLGIGMGAIALPVPIPYTAKGQGAAYVKPESDLGQQLFELIDTFKPCSSLTNFSAELVDSAREPKSLEGSPSETTLTLTPTPRPSTDTITQLPLFTQTFESFTQTDTLTFSPLDFPAPAHQGPALALDSITLNPVFGLKPCDASSRGVQTMWQLKTLKVLSIADYGKFLGDSEWLDIRGTIRSSYRQLGSALLTAGIDSSLLPTPTSYAEGSGTHQPAGQNKLERTLKLLPTVTASTGGVIQDLSKGGNRLERSPLPTPLARDGKGPTGTPKYLALAGTDKMNPAVPRWMMGFQPGYVEDILMAGGAITLPQDIQAFPPEPKVGEPALSSTVGPLCPNKQRSLFGESSTSTAYVGKWEFPDLEQQHQAELDEIAETVSGIDPSCPNALPTLEYSFGGTGVELEQWAQAASSGQIKEAIATLTRVLKSRSKDSVQGKRTESTGETEVTCRVTSYIPKGSARGERKYFRYSYRDEQGKLKNVHIPGGSITSPVALERKEAVVRAIAQGSTPNEIVAMIQGWKLKANSFLCSTDPTISSC